MAAATPDSEQHRPTALMRIEQATSTTSADTLSGGGMRTTQSSRPPSSTISPSESASACTRAARSPAGLPAFHATDSLLPMIAPLLPVRLASLGINIDAY